MRRSPRRRRRRDRRGDRAEADHHRRHPLRPRQPGDPGVDDLPGAGHPVAIEPKTKARPGEARHRDPEARRGGPDLPGPQRRGDRADDHRRHGRAAPRDAGRPDEARVQGRGQRRQAAGRLPRDHPQAGHQGRVHPQEADRWVRPVRARCIIDLEPTGGERRRTTSSTTRSPAAASRKEYIPSVDAGRAGRHAVRHPRRLPDGGDQGHAARRRLPRGRLLGDGLQDRRLDGVQGGRAQGQPGPARAHDGRRGHHPRGLHGRRDRRPQLPARP